MDWKDIRYRAEYVVFRLITCLFQILSWRMSLRVAQALAGLIRLLPRKWSRYHVARENLRIAFGNEISDARAAEIIHGMWVHLFRMIAEIIQMPRKLRLYNCADILQYRHRNDTIRTLCCGRPVLVLSGHFGNWEMAISTFGLYGFPLGVVARDLDNPYLHQWMDNFRRATGHRLISKRGGSDDMLSFIERGSHLGLLADQDAGPKGLFVDFFGHPASTFKSIALLAMQYRAVILVGYARRLPDDFRNNRWAMFEQGAEDVIDTDEFQGADAVRQITQRYTAALERIVRMAPEQYFWIHRRWKSEPKVRKKSELKAA